MDKRIVFPLGITLVAAVLLLEGFSPQREPDPWTEEQLVAPSELAATLGAAVPSELPLILAVNPDGMHGLPEGAVIKGAKWFGPVEKEENLDHLREYLQGIDREKDIILYCGCCPFRVCPNIRPTFDLLNTMQFKNHKLLNLPRNIKEDWIDKGYPMSE